MKLTTNMALFLLFLHCNVFGQATKAEAEIQEIMTRYSAVGLSVVAVKDNQLIYEKAFGARDLERGLRLHESDIFRIASISKSFAATAIMQLMEEKKLSLKDDISDLVGFRVRNPRYPDKVITLKMVLSHTSSINDSQGYFNFDSINPGMNQNWDKCYNDYAPGNGYEYCNLNFNMIGAVIERLSGKRFDVAIRERIVTPLGLYGGYCVDSLDADRFVTLYDYSPASGFRASPDAYAARREEIANYVVGYTTPVLSPTGGMKMSAPDLARYMIMHMNSGTSMDGVRVISKKSSRLMKKPVAKKEGYGFALRRVDDLIPGKVMIGHVGDAYGLHSAMFFHPKEDFGFVVISNGCAREFTGPVNNALREAMVTLYENLIKNK